MAATSNLLVEDMLVIFSVLLSLVQLKTVIPYGYITALSGCQSSCYQFKLLAPALLKLGNRTCKDE
jgi:hypothetical protein